MEISCMCTFKGTRVQDFLASVCSRIYSKGVQISSIKTFDAFFIREVFRNFRLFHSVDYSGMQKNLK